MPSTIGVIARALMTCVLAVALTPPQAHAASVYLFSWEAGAARAVVIEGEITPGDLDAFLRIVRENQGKVSIVYIFSPGGDFYEALKLGRAIRNLELDVRVPEIDRRGRPDCSFPLDWRPQPRNQDNCTAASAAFFIYLGGVRRNGFYIAVHRPTFVGRQLGQMTQARARVEFGRMVDSARAYMREMEVPQHVQDRVLATPPEQIWRIEEEVVRQYFAGNTPARTEWLKGRCGSMPPDEQARWDRYLEQGRAGINPSPSTQSDWDYLSQRENERDFCRIEAARVAQREAYVRTFGPLSSDDSRSHDFSSWLDADRYLGRRFSRTIAEDRFDEVARFGITTLTRPATVTAPRLLLFDTPGNPRIVETVVVLSSSNPSQAFRNRAFETLQTRWGRPDSSDVAEERWVWLRPEYSAILRHEPAARDGRSLSLTYSTRGPK